MNPDIVLANVPRAARRTVAIPSPPLLPALGVLFGLLLLALMWPRDPLLNRLELHGKLANVVPEAVYAALQPQLQSSFFDADLAAMKAAVDALPWVQNSRISRVWPGVISVRIWEREASARWNGEELLDLQGQIFAPARETIPQDLPALSGHPGQEAEVADAYQRLSTALAATPLALSGLSLDARGEWTAQTYAGVELRLGQGAPDEHVAVLTGSASRALSTRWREVAYVDLRYTNGFSVGWKDQAAEELSQ